MSSNSKQESFSKYDCKVVLTRLPLKLTRKISKGLQSPQQELQCHICEAYFETNQKMKLHMTSVHEKRRLHKCECCEISLSTKQGLDRHIASVHEGKKRIQSHGMSKAHCAICDEEFSSKKYLNEHISAIHKEKILFNCEICHKGFKWDHSYKVHMGKINQLVAKFAKKCSQLKDN